MRTLGFVTLYHPDAALTASNLRTYLPWVDRLVVWDNAPGANDNRRCLDALLADEAEKLIWMENGQNLGIARGLNYALHKVLDGDFDMLLMMDQDSNWPDCGSFMQAVARLHGTDATIGAFTPNVSGLERQTTDIAEKDFFITSGTVITREAIRKIVPVDETFAIDALDNECSIAIREKGFRIVCLTRHVLNHHIGNRKYSKIFHIGTPDYNAARTYGMCRNHIILIRKRKKSLPLRKKIYFIKEYIIYKLIRILLVEGDKGHRLRMLIKGISDGLTYKIR